MSSNEPEDTPLEDRFWWKHTQFKSNDLVDQIIRSNEEDDPMPFFVSDEEMLQLARDFKQLKNKFMNSCLWNDSIEWWEMLPDEEKWRRRQYAKQVEEEVRKIWDQTNLDEEAK